MSKKIFRRVITATMAAALMVTSIGGIAPGTKSNVKTASAAKVKKSGDFKYVKYSNGVKILKYTGKAKKVTIPGKIAGKKVVAIGASSFEANETIKQVKMPDSVKEIGDNAFADCAKLKKVTLSKKLESFGEGAFKSTALKKISVPATVKKINNMTFLGCDKLTSVTFGENVKVIGRSAFEGCGNLASIDLGNVEEIGIMAFKDAKSLAGELALKNVVSVGTEAFYGCNGITAVSFSDTLQLLGEREQYYSAPIAVVPPLTASGQALTLSGETSSNPFAYCTGLERFEVDVNNANYTSVDGVIYGKTNEWIVAYPAKKGGVVNIPETIKGIGEYAFSGAQISQVNMGKGLNTIRKEAFGGCTATEVKMPSADSVYVMWSKDAFLNCKALKKVVFPEGTNNINAAAFINCTALTDVVLPESMETLSDAMFLGCTALEKITLPKSVKNIPPGCFYGCKKLKDVNLDNIDSIASFSFFGCESLSGVLNLNVTGIKTAAFGECTGITEVNFNKPVRGFSWETSYDISMVTENEASDFIAEYLTKRSLIDSEAFRFGVNVYNDLYVVNPFVGCSKLTKINVLDENGSDIKSVGGVLFTSNMTRLISFPAGLTGKYNVPYGVDEINNSAFESSNATEVVLSNTVTRVDPYAFYKSKIKSVTLSKSVDTCEMVKTIFGKCADLEEIRVHASNKDYESIDGVLYDSDMKTLLVYPVAKKGKTFKVPAKKTIGDGAFDGCKNLRKVFIKEMSKYDTTKYFTKEFFKNCKNIKLYLPKNFNPKKIVKPETGKYTLGFGNSCEGGKTYVVKKSKLAKKLDKKKIKYRSY